MLLNFERKQLSGLVWLRFALAIYLVLFHTLGQINQLPNWLYQSVSAGYISTSTFFVLSGFVLAHAYLGDDGQLRISKRKFLSTRLLTVYPLHIVGLLLAALIMWVQYQNKGAVFAVADVPTAFKNLTTESHLVPLDAVELGFNALAHIFLVHAWNPYYLTYNVPAWSISTLVFFYIVFSAAGAYFYNVKKPKHVLAILVLVNLMAPAYFIATSNYSSVATGFLHTNPLVRLPEFLSGIVLCRVIRNVQQIPLPRARFILLVALTLATIVYVVSLFNQLGPWGYYMLRNGALLPLELILVVLFAGVRETKVVWLNTLGSRLANATLSIFILHLPLYFIFSRLCKLLFVVTASGEFNVATLATQVQKFDLPFAVYPFIVVAIVAISVLCQEQFVLKTRSLLLSGSKKPWHALYSWSTRYLGSKTAKPCDTVVVQTTLCPDKRYEDRAATPKLRSH